MSDGLLLLHAWPLDGSMWEPQIGSLEGRMAVVAPSFPGFGGAPPAGPVMTMASAAERAVADADAAGLGRFVACGLSMGGYVAFELWRTQRDRIAGLVLANTRSPADDEAGKDR